MAYPVSLVGTERKVRTWTDKTRKMTNFLTTTYPTMKWQIFGNFNWNV